MAARRMFGTRDLSVPSSGEEQRATRAYTSKITPAGVYRKTRKNTNRQTNILQNLKTVIYRVIEITTKIACVASVSVRFGSEELQRENGASETRGRGRGRKEGNACRQTPGF